MLQLRRFVNCCPLSGLLNNFKSITVCWILLLFSIMMFYVSANLLVPSNIMLNAKNWFCLVAEYDLSEENLVTIMHDRVSINCVVRFEHVYDINNYFYFIYLTHRLELNCYSHTVDNPGDNFILPIFGSLPLHAWCVTSPKPKNLKVTDISTGGLHGRS